MSWKVSYDFHAPRGYVGYMRKEETCIIGDHLRERRREGSNRDPYQK
jgi:hypothetical protein